VTEDVNQARKLAATAVEMLDPREAATHAHYRS